MTADSLLDSRLAFEGRLGRADGGSDDEWALIRPLLPAEGGPGCRPAQDNRRYCEGMMWVARTGAQWRHLPDDYGKWNSVFRRYRRWAVTRVFDPLLEALSELIERDRSADMIDSTVVRVTSSLFFIQFEREFPPVEPLGEELGHEEDEACGGADRVRAEAGGGGYVGGGGDPPKGDPGADILPLKEGVRGAADAPHP